MMMSSTPSRPQLEVIHHVQPHLQDSLRPSTSSTTTHHILTLTLVSILATIHAINIKIDRIVHKISWQQQSLLEMG